MVNPSCFAPPETRRFASHRGPYPLLFSAADIRRSSSEHSSLYESPGIGSMSNSGYDEGGGSHQRKRIPVACGRCRKRKIRCSGDNGVGEACTNCRNAGVSPCQFLRVSSQEAALKQDNGFSYNLMDSRTHHARGLTSLPQAQAPSVAPPVYQDGVPLSSIDAFQPYRSSSTYAYGTAAGGRAYIAWGTPAYSDPTQEQNPDGGYQHCGVYSPSYAPPSETRYIPPYQPAPGPTKPLPPFIEAESAVFGYGPHSTSIPTTTLAHRPAPGIDTANGVWCHGVAAGISSSTASNKQSYCRNDSVSAATAYSKSSSSPTSSVPEMTPTSSCGTGSYESSPVSSYPPRLTPTQQLPPISRAGDMYSTTTNTTTAATSSSSDFPPASTSSYVYTDTSAAAAAVTARRGPASSPTYTAPSYVTPHGLRDAERKPAVALRS